MEPNMMGNMQTPNPIAPEPVSTGQVVAEQVTVAQTEPAPVFKDEKKGGKGMLFGLILCLLLAAGGIGFGVWEMMDGNTQKDNLNKQITDLKAQVNDLKDKLASTSGSNGGDAPVDPNTGSSVDTADYIYIGEWGIKIKIPENLKRVSYSLRQSTDLDSTFLWVIGNIDERLPVFANPSNNSTLGTIGRLPISSLDGKDCHSETFELVFSDDVYNYCYSRPQGIASDLNSEMYGSEVKTIELIQEMLKTKDNYSAI